MSEAPQITCAWTYDQEAFASQRHVTPDRFSHGLGPGVGPAVEAVNLGILHVWTTGVTASSAPMTHRALRHAGNGF